jgi:hypothetical protein
MMWQSAGSVLPGIQGELGPEERVLWSGQPRPGVRLTGADAFLIPFSLLWCGGAISAGYSAIQSGTDPFGMAFVGVFVLAGHGRAPLGAFRGNPGCPRCFQPGAGRPANGLTRAAKRKGRCPSRRASAFSSSRSG